MDQKRRIKVVLGKMQHRVGELIFEMKGNRQSSAFRYENEWLENPISFALSPSMELTRQWYHFGGSGSESLPGPLSDSGPDDWGRTVLQTAAGRPLNEIDVLLAANDQTRMGALRFIDETGTIMSTSSNSVPKLASLSELRRINLLFERGEGDLPDLARRLQGTGGSLGGARPKSALLDGHHLAIAKYTSEGDTLPVERMEVATLNLAKETGLRASIARLELSDSSFPVAVIRRFDRRRDERMHYVSAKSFLGLQGDRDTSYYSDLAIAMKRHCGNSEQVIDELDELYRRVLFTILVSNTDDHLKNHGFLYSGNGRWQLSPAFDINPQPYRHVQLKTGISVASGFTASIEAAIEAAPLFEIDESQAAQMASRMAKAISERWRYWCLEAGMSRRECDRFAPAFNNSEMEFALSLGRSEQRA